MKALDIIQKIANSNLIHYDLKYCLMTASKLPKTINGDNAKPNDINDFVSLDELCNAACLWLYSGVGISIQASNICAIDVDHCFSIKNDITSADNRAKQLLDIFKDCYCEFSFSGTGLRILFKHSVIDNYSNMYYIKNEKNGIEYYQPNDSFRYVSITGNSIFDNKIVTLSDDVLYNFLNTYMKRQTFTKYDIKTVETETKEYDELLLLTKKLYLTNFKFQNLWFSRAPGSGADESERDYQIVAFLYENITRNKEMLKQLFESSPYFASKDEKHLHKWTYSNYRYFDYIYNMIRRKYV